MKFTEKEDGTYLVQSENENESQIMQVIIEMAVLAWKAGELTDDQVNESGHIKKDGMFLNYCTIPGQEWVSREARKCAA